MPALDRDAPAVEQEQPEPLVVELGELAGGAPVLRSQPRGAQTWYARLVDASKVATLKKKLLEAKDLTEILEYFFDEFGNDPAFVNSGEPLQDGGRFLAALGQVAIRVVGESRAVLRGTVVRVAEHALLHGAFDLGQWTFMMFYFEDVEQGFIALGDASGPDRFVRFSLVGSPDGKPILVH